MTIGGGGTVTADGKGKASAKSLIMPEMVPRSMMNDERRHGPAPAKCGEMKQLWRQFGAQRI